MKGFQKISTVAAAATFLLIGIGGFVRAAGAGLGCPDWPRCFGRWIPPTDVSQLPAEIDPARFNFALAWIEYANRLVGVLVGLLIVAVVVSAWRVHRQRPGILRPAIAAALLVAVQGWLGGQVVAYELDPRFVTVHLLVALAIGALLLHLVVAGFDAESDRLPRPTSDPSTVFGLAVVTLGAASIQIVIGALVRGSIEMTIDAEPLLDRGLVLGRVGLVDEIHKTGAVVVALLSAWVYAGAHRGLQDTPGLRRLAQAPAWVALAQIAVGLGLSSRALPPALQLVHLAAASLLFAALVLAALLLAPRRYAALRTRHGPAR